MPAAGNNNPQSNLLRARNGAKAIVLLAMAICLQSGCSLFPDIKHKPQFTNPFPQLRTIAVLPFSNQSQEPTLSGERVALAYMNELQAIRGFEVLPLGAVKLKLAQFQRPLATGEDFQGFAQFLGVDAVIIGSVTDYSAYYPPRMSMKVNWYAANPGFHTVQPGYGLPWGTKAEKDIPRWVQQDAQRALAAEQLKTQTPNPPVAVPIMPEDRADQLTQSTSKMPKRQPEDNGIELASGAYPGYESIVSEDEDWAMTNNSLPTDWPDPRGFLPDAPSPNRPEYIAQHEPIISHVRNFNGHDEDFTEQLAEYFYYRDDARFGGWQAYLQRSEDFIRFCCYLHLSETLVSRGGQDESRLILRWPIDRYIR